MLRQNFPAVIWLVVAGMLLNCASAATPIPTVKPPATPDTLARAPAAETSAAKPASLTPTAKPSSEQPRYGGVLTIATSGDPLSLDMLQESANTVQNVIQCAYSGVTQFDPNSPEEVIGDLAKNWEISKDGITYTFNLHDGVKFHDGSPLAAEDVKFSFERMFNPPKGTLSPRRADLAAIEKIEAPDENKVRLILKYPSSPFLSIMSTGWMAIYSRAFVEKRGDMRKDVMGTGPYKLKRYSVGTSLEYVKNTDYFLKGRPYLDGITFYIVKDAATRLAAFRTGQIKLTAPGPQGLSASDAEAIKKTMPQAIVMPYPAFSSAYFVMNNQRKLWTDVRVRKAVHLALDRQNAIKVLEQGYGEIGSYFPGKWGIPKQELEKMPGWRQPKDADIAEAKQLLADAGYPDGFSVKALVRAEKQFEELSVYVADQLAKVRIKLELDVKETAVRTQSLNQGTFDCHPVILSLAIPDPEDTARRWAPPRGDDWAMNWQRFTDEKVSELFDKQSRAIDPAERSRIVRELDLRMIELESMPVIYWRSAILSMWPEVKDRGKVAGFFCFQKYQDIWLAK